MNEKDIILKIRNIEEEKIDDFIEERIKLLEENTKEKKDSISFLDKEINLLKNEECVEFEGFISKNNKIKFAGENRNLIMDDYTIYKDLIRVIRQAEDKKIKNNNFIMDMIQRRIMIYLGMSDSKEKRNEIYNSNNEDISIKELRGKNVATSLEKSVIGQNLLTFLGYESLLVYGKYSNEESANKEMVYNCVLREKSGMLIDFSKPIYAIKDEKIQYLKPSIYKIDLEKLNELKKGNAIIDVEHYDYIIENDDKKIISKRNIYSSKNIDIDILSGEKDSELKQLEYIYNSLQNQINLKENILKDLNSKDKKQKGVEL